MTSILTNLDGYLAAVVGTFLMLPQVLKLYKTKKAKDVAMMMVMLYVANCFLWLIHGLRIADGPVTIANAIALVISIAQFILKIKYNDA